MTGSVIEYQARVAVSLLLPNNQEITLDFVVDTGFEGAMTLPLETVQSLNLPFFTQLTANLADDSGVPVDVYVGVIRWQDEEKRIAVLAMGTRPLLGTALLAEHRVQADFTDGGAITITPLTTG
jgi:clan AA aspartic protease